MLYDRYRKARRGSGMGSTRDERLERVYSARSTRELAESYDEWAGEYERDMLVLGYTIPAVAAGFAGRYVPPEGRVLDAGVGTGILGDVLRVLEYRDLTGIDLSKGMLERAREKGAYRELHRMVLGERLGFDDSAFDAVVSVGVFTEGHAPPESFDELVRVVKPGGWLVFSVRADVYENGGFQEKQAALEEAGAWEQVRMSVAFRPFPAGDSPHRNRVFVYRAS
jgi:predicted TPR repeat methyltransferase